jgi:tetratricopeptide (TPR) repeat protein
MGWTTGRDSIIGDVKESTGVAPEAKVQAFYNQAESALFAGQLDRSRLLYSNAIAQLGSLELKPRTKKQLEGMAKYRLARIAYLNAPSQDSLTTYRDALDEFSANYGPGHRHVAAANNELVIAYLQNQAFDNALELAELSFKHTREDYGLASIQTLLAVDKILIASCRTLDRSESKERLEESVKIMEQNLPIAGDKHGIEHPNIVAMNSNLARAYGCLGQRDEQIRTLERLVKSLERKLGHHSPQTRRMKLELAKAVVTWQGK